MLLTDDLLLNYKRCHRRAFLDVYGDKKYKEKDRGYILQQEEQQHFLSEQVFSYYNLIPQQSILSLNREETDYQKLAFQTEELMRQGVDYIHKGVIILPVITMGKEIIFKVSPTFLIKKDVPSLWGDWSYFPLNTHWGKKTKPDYKLIVAFQAYILSQIQGINTSKGELFLRHHKKPHYVNLSLWTFRAMESVKHCLSLLMLEDIPEVFISRQKCSFCSWYKSCYTVAKKQQSLSLIPTVNQKKYELLTSNDITNFATLAKNSLSDLTKIFPPETARQIYNQSLSIRTQQPILKKSPIPPIPNDTFELYFDIEAGCDRTLDYLLGILLVDHQNKTEIYYSFLAKKEEEEKLIWQQFIEFINQYPNAPIFHYSDYEVETIRRLGYLYKTDYDQLKSILSRLFDLQKIITNYLYLPVESYSLKFVASWMGFQWRDVKTGQPSSFYRGIGGDQCVYWYNQWLKTNDPIWLEYILIYNEDDCRGTYQLKKWFDLQKFSNE